MTHTKGPWSQDKYGTIISANGKTLQVSGVALPCGFDASRNETKANSRLIAAAPELLEALRDLEAMAERYRQPGAPIPDAQKSARAAIAKATGNE